VRTGCVEVVEWTLLIWDMRKAGTGEEEEGDKDWLSETKAEEEKGKNEKKKAKI
jgi:hypothetical protein